jgi:hypothetical protein
MELDQQADVAPWEKPQVSVSTGGLNSLLGPEVKYRYTEMMMDGKLVAWIELWYPNMPDVLGPQGAGSNPYVHVKECVMNEPPSTFRSYAEDR